MPKAQTIADLERQLETYTKRDREWADKARDDARLSSELKDSLVCERVRREASERKLAAYRVVLGDVLGELVEQKTLKGDDDD